MSRSFDRGEVLRLLRLGRRAEQRGKAMKGLAHFLFTYALHTAARAWLSMLAIGILHHWSPAIPPIGFWDAAALVAVLAWVLPLHDRWKRGLPS